MCLLRQAHVNCFFYRIHHHVIYSPVRPPYLVRRYYFRFLWRMSETENTVYLTFDDGPIPGVTERALDVLKEHNATATFFCIGKNVEKHPAIYKRILAEGHSIGNHTQNHVNGWNVNTRTYVTDALRAADVIDSPLFRPPYGRIKLEQSEMLLKRYRIVMWDILSYDYDAAVSPQQCLLNVTTNIRPGSIIVFHDSLKAKRNMEYALPRVLEFLKAEGYRCEGIR
jgi:peptidoglycan/xylan/chitin deacetylase (PgdA/CDA1 family)